MQERTAEIAPYSNWEASNLRKIENTIRILKQEGLTSDIDGVDIDTTTNALDLYNRITGDNKKLSDVKKHYIMADWLAERNVTGQEATDLAKYIWDHAYIIQNASPESGSDSFSNFLHKQGLIVPRITSRPSSVAGETLNWYSTNMPWVKPELINIASENTNEGIEFKVDKINELGMKYHFEDAFEHAEEIIKHTKATVLLVPQYWNLDYKSQTDRIITVDGLNFFPVRAIFEELARRIG